MTAESASIVVATIAAAGGILASVISGIHRRETRDDHNQVGSNLDRLVGTVDMMHVYNQNAHEVIRDDMRVIVARLDRHIDEERRGGGDRREHDVGHDPERRRGVDRRDSDIHDL